MKISAQIKALTIKLSEIEAERNEMVMLSATAGKALTAEQVTRAEAITQELEAGKKQLAVLSDVEKSLAAQAVAIPRSEAAAAANINITGTSRVSVERNAPKGSIMTRFAMLQAKAKGNLTLVGNLAEQHYKDDDKLQAFVKAAVAAGTASVADWAGSLIYPQEYLSDFIELLYPQTVLGRLNLRKIPFNVTVAGQTGGTSVGWVGEASPMPVTAAAFNRIYLTHTKIAALAVLSEELIRFSNPAAEAMVQADLLKAASKGLDLSFLGNAAAVANVSPAGMLNGVTAFAASGTTWLSVITDVQALLAPFIALNYDVTSAVIVMQPSLALSIGQLRNALGGQCFPNLDMEGGTLLGIRVITSNNAAPGTMTLFIQDEIYLSEDAAPQIDLSKEASIIMDSAPASASSAPVSMFQTGQVAIRVTQMINWQLRRSAGAASQVTGCAYVSEAPAA
ncbi:phage major capsid protein [Paraburkholderia ferrariae]|uniref:phage major capsid protein n=1 Tax=Paraburkholderia ferrariae TaxID=386056 RepID=UPI00048955AA|nr:phage major capsid protein [Paraburkholderia ferrariae]